MLAMSLPHTGLFLHDSVTQGVILTKPVVYGNVARYFGKKREEDGHTHSWVCYLRPYKNEVPLLVPSLTGHCVT